MARCEVCGNDYEPAMEITIEGASHTFDAFECAIHALAPRCGHCGCAVIGHGHQAGGSTYCSAHCARAEGHDEVAHRA